MRITEQRSFATANDNYDGYGPVERLKALGAELSDCLNSGQGDALRQLAEKLTGAMCEPALLAGIYPECGELGYGRELVYVDPSCRFTMLVLRWEPGARTPVHGHKAWGVVGVYEGVLGVSGYEHRGDGNYSADLREVSNVIAKAGDTCAVGPDPEGIHCIYNDSEHDAFSVHLYGMDLSTDSNEININY